jgi:hypothetical protein
VKPAPAPAPPARAVIRTVDVTMRSGDGLPPSDTLDSSALVRGLADAPSRGGAEPVAFIVDAGGIHILQS